MRLHAWPIRPFPILPSFFLLIYYRHTNTNPCLPNHLYLLFHSPLIISFFEKLLRISLLPCLPPSRGWISSPGWLLGVAAMTRVRAVWRPTAVLLAVASLSCVLSLPPVSAAAGAEVAVGAAHRNTERIAGEPPSRSAWCSRLRHLVVATFFIIIYLMDWSWIVIISCSSSALSVGIVSKFSFGTCWIGCSNSVR